MARDEETRLRRYVAGGGAAALVLAAAIGVVFQDNIVRFAMIPRTPFQLTPAPPAPDYRRGANWALRPSAEDGAEDAAASPAAPAIFYVHSVTYDSADAWNADVRAREPAATLAAIALPNEIGPFLDAGSVYAPRYRQATLGARFTHKYDGQAARRLAFTDVDRAFAAFLADEGVDGRPIVLVGYGQGAHHLMGVLKKRFDGPDNPLRARLVAAYLLDHAAPRGFFEAFAPPLAPCDAPDATGCVVAYAARSARFGREVGRLRSRGLVWTDALEQQSVKGPEPLCVNPLNWRVDGGREEPARHVGAASATGPALGVRPPAVSKAVGAACVDGVLIVDRPRAGYLRRAGAFGGKWRAQPFNLFFHDLARNVATRIDAADPGEPREP